MNVQQQKIYDYLVIFAREHGCELLSDKYVRSLDPLNFRCPSNHIKIANRTAFIRCPTACVLCPNKKAVKSRKIFIENIKALGGEVTGEYVDNKTPVKCICKNGHVCSPNPTSIQQGQGMCLECVSRSPEQSRSNFIKSIEDLGGKVTGEYIDNRTPINCICKNNHKCSPIPNNIREGQGMCVECVGLSPEQSEINFIENIKNLGGKVVEKYINSATKIKCMCKNGHECSPIPNHIQQGRGMCKKCVDLCPIESEKKFRERVLKLEGIILGDYVNTRTPVHCRCKNGHDCYPKNNSGDKSAFCKICTIEEQKSNGEKLVIASLDLLNLEYNMEITPNELQRLRFDFSFKYNDETWYVEYDGKQHQKYIEYFYKSKILFEKARQRDLIKNKFIRETNNCRLIRLDHISWGKRTIFNQTDVEKLVFYIQDCFCVKDQKIFYNLDVYDWINDEPDKDVVDEYFLLKIVK